MHTLLGDDKSASDMRSVTLCPLLFLIFSRRNLLTDIETRDGIESHVFGLLNIDKVQRRKIVAIGKYEGREGGTTG
jgi:hypothetical protein